MKSSLGASNTWVRRRYSSLWYHNPTAIGKSTVHVKSNEHRENLPHDLTLRSGIEKIAKLPVQELENDKTDSSVLLKRTTNSPLKEKANGEKYQHLQALQAISKSHTNMIIPQTIYEIIHSNKCTFKESLDNNIRTNQINMQMLSKSLYNQIFPNVKEQKNLSPKELRSVANNLNQYKIRTEDATRLPDVDIKIPPLEGKDIEEHFFNIAKAQVTPYTNIINHLIGDIPEVPKQWVLKEGWTRYTADGIESVDYPLEDAVVFDVEVCMSAGSLPTIATAVSKNAWYGWVSKSLIDCSNTVYEEQRNSIDVLIPMESTSTEYGLKLTQFQKQPKIIVGHNVSYDRKRIKEQYWLNCTGSRFLDTMSLHVCVSGINSYQRTILNSKKIDNSMETWQSQTSLNSLADVYKLYCGREIKKDTRDMFVNGTLQDIHKHFNEVMSYCASDVIATQNVLHTVYPIFQERFPHPVTLAGMLELGNAYLPVNSNWHRYLEEAESTFEDVNYEAKFTLARRADEVCKLMHDEKYKQDLWMWDQDWSTQKIKIKSKLSKQQLQAIKKKTEAEEEKKLNMRKQLADEEEDSVDPLEKEFAYLEQTKYLLPAVMPHMPGYPAWYRKLCLKSTDENWVPGPQNISVSMQVVPKLLNLMWENYPLHYIKDAGWGILVPYSDNLDIETNLPLEQLLTQCPLPQSENVRDTIDYEESILRNDIQRDLQKTEFWRYKKKKCPAESKFYKGSALWCNTSIDNCCYFFKLPHKDGSKYNVGNPLAKDFLNKFSDNVLSGLDASASEVLKTARMLSYWRNNRDRIMSQLVIWLPDNCIPSSMKKFKKQVSYGAIIPSIVVSGTLTRRAVESTWMTASNAHPERIGSELRSMIQAPPGYNFIGADVDSQELWIASVIGDAYSKKIHGCTPFGWMTLIGTKSNSTDMHSITAKAVGISRDHAKIINYARIYGAGQRFAERLLKQFNPSMTEAEAASKARKMFYLTKGRKVYRLYPEYISDVLSDKDYTSYDAHKIAKLHGKGVQDMFTKGTWENGSESAMFNRLEEIAESAHPVTPFLNARLSRALEDNEESDKYLPTKINWVVQSGAVDFLHLMLVSMRWLMKDNIRFCLSFHDEIRYLVPSRYKYNAALAMHVTNLLTRCFCSSKLGIKDLPMSVAFFGSVEVDTVLRKEASHDNVTPSNPHGLEKGYNIPPGESVDIYAAIEKSEGLQIIMSKATKRKYVEKEISEMRIPTESQSIVQVIEPRGNNLHEVVDAMGEQYLVSMPTKFRRNIWVKRGHFVLVEPIAEGDKVKAEIIQILTREHIKYYRAQNCWPQKFDQKSNKENQINDNNEERLEEEEELFVNTNRIQQITNSDENSTTSDSD
ncbi:hypothetical protein KM043_005810 [Ampulex compressa]|nr:hypothetical protein KM043_005810 [Ampulex compressa]